MGCTDDLSSICQREGFAIERHSRVQQPVGAHLCARGGDDVAVLDPCPKDLWLPCIEEEEGRHLTTADRPRDEADVRYLQPERRLEGVDPSWTVWPRR